MVGRHKADRFSGLLFADASPDLWKGGAHNSKSRHVLPQDRGTRLGLSTLADFHEHVAYAPKSNNESKKNKSQTKSIGEGRRLIKNGGVRIDNEKVTSFERELEAHEIPDEGLVLRVGKKRAVRVLIG